MASYVNRKLSCYITIGDSATPYDVVQVTTEFALNSIPTATVALALGMNTKTLEAAAASEIGSSLFEFRKPIKIWAEYPDAPGSTFLIGGLTASEEVSPKVIFEGYIAGVGYQRNASGAALSISAEHWLADLAASSMMGSSTHSMTPGDLQRSALLISARPGDGRAQINNYGLMGTTWVSKVIGDTAGLIDNLWDGGIKKIAIEGAKADALIDVNRAADPACANNLEAKNINNQAALSAIARMEGKLPFRLNTAENVIYGIYRDLTSVFLENIAGQTIWDVIVSASANYMFAIAPGISKAAVIPFLPCLSAAEPFYTIPSEEIFSVSLSGDMPRTIRGLAVLFSTETGVMGLGGKQTAVPALRVGGAYIGTGSDNCKGTVLYKQPPSWLSTACAAYYATGRDKNPSNTIRTSTSPTGGTASDKGTTTENIIKTMKVRDDYAKCLYGFEILKGRQGTISGPFRTDIGVGSYIEFELPSNLNEDESTPKYFRGIVLKVSTTLDAQSSQAGTTFIIGYARTQVEDSSALLTMTEHPIYNATYLGNHLDYD